jgi:hypothetical protein
MGRALSVHRTWKRVDRSLPLHLFLPDSTSPHALLMDGNRIFAAESNVLCILQVTRRGRETIFEFFFSFGFHDSDVVSASSLRTSSYARLPPCLLEWRSMPTLRHLS